MGGVGYKERTDFIFADFGLLNQLIFIQYNLKVCLRLGPVSGSHKSQLSDGVHPYGLNDEAPRLGQ